MSVPGPERAWHQALAYAVTGRRLADLSRQAVPDVEALAVELRTRTAPSELTGSSHQVPPDLMEGIGAAQFVAVLGVLRQRLAADWPTSTQVARERPLEADDRRLLREVPPHHAG